MREKRGGTFLQVHQRFMPWQYDMAKTAKLDLLGVVTPICLLKSKEALGRMHPGEVLEIWVQDPEVIESLSKILEHSGDRLEGSFKEKDSYRILVRKG